MGTRTNIGIDTVFKGYPKIRKGLKALSYRQFAIDFPMTIINTWINGCAGDARKKKDTDADEGDADEEDAGEYQVWNTPHSILKIILMKA